MAILQYLKHVEDSLARGDTPSMLRHLVFPLKTMIPHHSEELLESQELNTLNESIRNYIEFGVQNSVFNSENEDVLEILKDILNIKLQNPMCTGPSKNLPPHKAEPTLFDQLGLCSQCILKATSSKGGKKGSKAQERSDVLRQNILQCLEDVLEGYDKKDIEVFLKSDEVNTGEELYQKLKAMSMSKTDGNWTKLKDKINRDLAKLGKAYGVNAVAYMYHPTLKKIFKLGGVRENCKTVGKKTNSDGQVINTFIIAEDHITEVLMSVKTDPKPTLRQAYEATKVIKALNGVGISKMSKQKIEEKFSNSPEFCLQYEKWMDEVEKEEKKGDEDNNIDYDTVSEGDQDGDSQEEDTEEVGDQNYYGCEEAGNSVIVKEIIVNEEGMDEGLQLVPAPGVCAPAQVAIQTPVVHNAHPDVELEFVDENDVSLMKSFTKGGKLKKGKRKPKQSPELMNIGSGRNGRGMAKDGRSHNGVKETKTGKSSLNVYGLNATGQGREEEFSEASRDTLIILGAQTDVHGREPVYENQSETEYGGEWKDDGGDYVNNSIFGESNVLDVQTSDSENIDLLSKRGKFEDDVQRSDFEEPILDEKNGFLFFK